MPIACLACVTLGVFLVRSGNFTPGVLLVTFGVLFAFLSTYGSLMDVAILANTDGISAYKIGRRIKFIRWQDISKVKKIHRWNAGSRSYQDVYYVFDKPYPPISERLVNFVGPITFTDEISNLPELINKVNESAREFGFSLSIIDQEASQVRRLRPAEIFVAEFNDSDPCRPKG